MIRAINITVGVLLFAAGTFVAFVSYAMLSDGLLQIFVTHWWTWSVLVCGCVLALAAVGLFWWRRSSAIVASVAALILATLYFPTSHFRQADYSFSVVFFTFAGLTYWRFLHTYVFTPIHTKA